MHATNRRDFFKASILGTAAATLAANEVSAASPPKRNGHSHMKLSLAGYSFNRFLPKSWTSETIKDAEMTYDDFFHFCAEHNFDGCEPTAYYFPKEVTNDYLMHVKQLSFRLGLDISGTAIGNDFCLPEGEKRDAQLKMCRDWIDRAATMGAPVIRIFAGKVPKGDNEQAAIERCVAGINECLEYAATKGVFLALENHGGITSTPAQMMRIIDAVKDSPWFGVNLDGGNFRTDDPYRDLAVIAPYAVNAQVKVQVTRDGKKEHADLGRVVKILKDADYRGYVVLEYEEREPHKEIPMYAKKLRDLIHG
ncbi:MAG: xylose isomerase [Planctomycetaceae bacterium]|nr:xylose isomerase [Planctomycetaceae bacterium]